MSTFFRGYVHNSSRMVESKRCGSIRFELKHKIITDTKFNVCIKILPVCEDGVCCDDAEYIQHKTKMILKFISVENIFSLCLFWMKRRIINAKLPNNLCIYSSYIFISFRHYLTRGLCMPRNFLMDKKSPVSSCCCFLGPLRGTNYNY